MAIFSYDLRAHGIELFGGDGLGHKVFQDRPGVEVWCDVVRLPSLDIDNDVGCSDDEVQGVRGDPLLYG